MKLNTKTSTLTTRQLSHVVRQTLIWCINNMGTKKRLCAPTYRVMPQKKGEIKALGIFRGSYCQTDNRIYVHPEPNQTLKYIIRTVLHEYTHYKQPLRPCYWSLERKYGYKNNPMEVEARKSEKLVKKCWKQIKKTI